MGDPEVVKFVFSHSKLRKKLFSENFKIQGGQDLPAPLPTPVMASLSKEFAIFEAIWSWFCAAR